MYGLDDKRQEILGFIDGITNEQSQVKPDEESWSMLEVLEHLYLMEQLVIYQIGKALKEGDDQQVSEKPIHRTPDRSRKVAAPEAVQPKGEFKSLEDARSGLAKSREATMFLIHNKDEETLKNRAFPHPAFGDMNLVQWVEFIGWHELRHLDQMKEVKESIS
ncbi:DinB family protein [Halobacillus amylolyticus]|uniref:DinB family protein n=1 Tax=Halobacillus amylolyticus TaxID=2932259 RepID=A0ABY4HF36_9BACI|nr:DinB family protein [Halobacillus amylolyticus]UOR13492.1 DinB family protein [Halobacillus amylolyticus]